MLRYAVEEGSMIETAEVGAIVLAVVAGAAGSIKAAFDWGSSRAKAQADVETAKAEAAGDIATASSRSETAKVALTDSNRKRIDSLEHRLDKAEETANIYRMKNWDLENQLRAVTLQLETVSKQLAEEKAAHIEVMAKMAAMTVEMTALRLMLKKYEDVPNG